MKRMTILFPVTLLLASILLMAFSPDVLSLIDAGIMFVLSGVGVVLCLLPLYHFIAALERGCENVRKASEVQTEAAWVAAFRMESLFRHRTLDRAFKEYKEKAQKQWETGQIICDVENYINVDLVDTMSWNALSAQIPGTYTGLGILGTFIGLLVGLRSIGFDTVQAALTSVEQILQGIDVAFYTSISGVILSIIYNIGHNFIYNIVDRQLSMFVDSFHKYIIPTVEEQTRYRQGKENRQMLALMERLPKQKGFSVSNGQGDAATSVSVGNEQILMPQILAGLKNGEFIFYLQPRYDLNTRKIVGGDALVRWNHSTLGILSPAVFIPILEQNGYITKLDQYIWEEACKKMRAWIDAGKHPSPIAFNVTKTDILAMDVPEFFQSMLDKYRIPPRSIDITISKKAYIEAGEAITDVEKRLMQAGFRVMMDGFDGDFVALSVVEHFETSYLELDLRYFDSQDRLETLSRVFEKAKQLHLTIFAVGIENAEQLMALRRCGCTEGQGYYFSKPLSIEDFEKEVEKDA